mmetsp:Transcript_141367/g.352501  ORF Transcript_141367/g.352501 Transcript_141367/m.352501 type:complete len:221 (-) Transcript_141367:55-717(-)
MVLAGPCSRMQPLRNSWNSMEPLLSVSSMSNRHLASERSTSIDRKNSWTSADSKWLSISSKVMTPEWFTSSVRKRRLAWFTFCTSFTCAARSIACCTNVAVTTFMTARIANEMYTKKRTPIQGETCEMRGSTRSFQSTPPVRPWNSDSTARGTEPYHTSRPPRAALAPPPLLPGFSSVAAAAASAARAEEEALSRRCRRATWVMWTPKTYTISMMRAAAQ